MTYGFCALFSRMSFIERWGLMRNSRNESLAEHAAVTACVANVLALTAKQRYGADVDPNRVATAALYHDLAETLTGDMPTPVKYRNEDLRRSYKQVEREAEQQVSSMLPEELSGPLFSLLSGDGLTERERRILKAADKVSALIKCIEERRSGNSEFQTAEKSTAEALQQMDLPELSDFLRDYLPAYNMTLDQLMETARKPR